MREVLLINLKRNGDIFAMGNIVKSLVAQDSEQRISLLVLKEFEKAAYNLSGVYKIHTLDRKKVLTYKKNKIFSDGFALNQFNNDISSVKGTNWDLVINYSNDRVSTHITSYLTTDGTKHAGIKFNKLCNVEHSNEWSIVYNEVLTQLKYSPINFIDTLHNVLELKKDTKKFILRTNKEYSDSAFKNFLEIRKTQSDSQNVKLVGIQLTASTKSKMMPKEELITLIDKLYMDPRYFPVILSAPTDEERNLVSSINSEFNNSLVSIEADFLALNSVLMNLDLLITPDTAIKHLADLCDLPTIEISLGESPLFKQGSVNPKSLIITPRIDRREFSKKLVDSSLELQSQNILINHTDIFALTGYILHGECINEHKFQNNVSIYQPTKDDLGTRYRLIQGTLCGMAEIERITSRILLMKNLIGKQDSALYFDLISFGNEQLEKWLEYTRGEITDLSKYLLATLRSLLVLETQSNKTQSFIKNLTELCSFCENDSQFMRIPILKFRAKLESVNTSDILASRKEVESLLYDLKADIQQQVEVISTAKGYLRNSKNVSRQATTKEVINEL